MERLICLNLGLIYPCNQIMNKLTYYYGQFMKQCAIAILRPKEVAQRGNGGYLFVLSCLSSVYLTLSGYLLKYNWVNHKMLN